MRIGFISVNDKPTSTLSPGGTEVFVSSLAKEFVKRGHEVYIFASGDSHVEGVNVVKSTNESLAEIQRQLKTKENYEFNYFDREFISNMLCLRNIALAKQYEDRIDIFHDNTASPIVAATLDILNKPVISTLHMPITDMYKHKLISQYITHTNLHYVSISKYQQKQLPLYSRLIYNGIDTKSYLEGRYCNQQDIIWIGRIDPNTPKGLDEAIIASKKTGHKLTYVGFIENNDYYEKKIYPLLDEKIIKRNQFKSLGEKVNFYKSSKVSLIPIQWEEPFGLTFIESMAAGTPVITYAKGAAPEIIKDGETGFIINSSEEDIRGNWVIKECGIKGLCEAINKIYSMSEEEYTEMRNNCISHVQENFTISHMANNYENLYSELLK